MFRAVREFDGSDSEKFITLKFGDRLTAVHIVDDAWFIGHNERSGETGAFLSECVINEDAFDSTTHTADPKWIMRQRSVSVSQIDDHVTRIIDQSMDRDRSMSSGAINFDVNRLRATKPLKRFRLKPVSTLNDGKAGQSTEAAADINDVFSIPLSATLVNTPSASNGTDLSAPSDASSTTSKSSDIPPTKHSISEDVEEISKTKLGRSLSGPESVMDWHESSFEDSFQHEVEQSDTVGENTITRTTMEIFIDIDSQTNESAERKLSYTRTSSKTLLNVWSALVGLLYVGLMLITLVFVFHFPIIAACTVVTITMICIATLFILTSAFKCMLSILFPSMASGVGVAFLYSMLLCLILNGPVANVSKNLRQTGHNLACMIDLVSGQELALQRKSNDFEDDIVTHIEQQRETLKAINSAISLDFDIIETSISATDEHLETLIDKMTIIYQNCSTPLETSYTRCLTTYCNQFSEKYLKLECEKVCLKIKGLEAECTNINIGENLAEASSKSKLILERAKDNMKIDISVWKDRNTSGYVQSDVKITVDQELDHKVTVFGHFILILLITMSLSLIVVFVWSFNVYKRYLSNDAYQNVYITERLRKCDELPETNGSVQVLPLKGGEKQTYFDIKSPALSKENCHHLKNDIKNLFVHFLITAMIIVLDCALHYVVSTIRRVVKQRNAPTQSSNFQINVVGGGPVAHFYEGLFIGFYLYDDLINEFKSTLHQCTQSGADPADTYDIAGFVVCYLVLICIIASRGFAPRLQGILFGLHYPEQERDRIEYLRSKIQFERSHSKTFFPQAVKTRYKEILKTNEFSLWTMLESRIPCLSRFVSKRDGRAQRCIGCGNDEADLSKLSLCYCTPEISGLEIVYCVECEGKLNDRCPICTTA